MRERLGGGGADVAEKRKLSDDYNDQVKVKKNKTCLRIKKYSLSRQTFGRVYLRFA